MMRKVITYIMAGGKGERLLPLTRDRAKPAVPFGGIYRIVDFTLNNCINSGLRRIYVLTQYKSASLHRHIRLGWGFLPAELGQFIEVVPAQKRIGDSWYLGTADAIYQNIYIIEDEHAEEVLILAGDHIYKMDYYKMIESFRQKKADFMVAAVEVDKDKSHQLGVIEVEAQGKVNGFAEKPVKPKVIPGKPDKAYGSMGIYVFKRDVLEEELGIDAKNRNSSHDFGRDIIPQMLAKKRKILVYSFPDENKSRVPYWRDIGNIDAYYEANMDLLQEEPLFDLCDTNWPIRTYQEQFPPAKTASSGGKDAATGAVVLDSLVSAGCVVKAATVKRSILSCNIRINNRAEVVDSILMEGVTVGSCAKIKRAIIDKGVNIPQNTVIGYDSADDKKRFYVSESGIVVVAKATKIK